MTAEEKLKSSEKNDTNQPKDDQSSNWRERILNSNFFNDNSAKEEEKWGYDLYPERKQLFKSTIAKIMKMQEGREQFDKIKCEENVYECVKSSPLVKIMMGALESAGW